MSVRPPAEIEVTAGLVGRLLAAQHPDLAHLDLGDVVEGWDNAIVRLGPDLAVRLPRRAVAVDLARKEQRWLTVLGGLVPVGVPRPVRRGTPSPDYPWPWSVVPWFSGRLVADLPTGARVPLATDLADVLTGLHVPAPAEAPRNPVRGGPLAARDEAVRARLAAGVAAGVTVRALDAWERALGAPASATPPVWLHGDLHPANLLADDDARLVALLDFGDLGAGDRATDLATAWLTFDRAGRAALRDRLPDVDESAWTRARGWALVMATAMLAHAAADPVIGRIGRHTLAAVLED